MLFQDYLVVGSLLVSGTGTAMLLLDRSRLYQWASRISIIGLFFPFLYMIGAAEPGKFVLFNGQFNLFYQVPALVISVLNVLFAYPTFVGDLKGKRLAVNYALLSATMLIGAIYTLPALLSFTASLAASSVFATTAFFVYKMDRDRGIQRKRVLEAIGRRGTAKLEDVMEDLRLSDAEVDSLLYELWTDDLVEKDESTGSYSKK